MGSRRITRAVQFRLVDVGSVERYRHWIRDDALDGRESNGGGMCMMSRCAVARDCDRAQGAVQKIVSGKRYTGRVAYLESLDAEQSATSTSTSTSASSPRRKKSHKSSDTANDDGDDAQFEDAHDDAHDDTMPKTTPKFDRQTLKIGGVTGASADVPSIVYACVTARLMVLTCARRRCQVTFRSIRRQRM
jgi:hypothetical protein